MSLPHHELDVRPILREGGEPFSAIMEAVAVLAPGQSLRLLAPFKPIPLFGVLGARGLEHAVREIGHGDWEVIFSPAQPIQQSAEQSSRSASIADIEEAWPAPVMELDNRDLDPPEPMVKALEAVESLTAGQTIAVRLPREPVFLFDELDARGHRWRGTFEPEGQYRIVIRSSGPGRSGHERGENEMLVASLRESLRLVIDPELGENIVDLGMIYQLAVWQGGTAHIVMTTTTPACPATDYLEQAVQSAARMAPGICEAEVRLTHVPPWTPEMMSAEAKRRLGSIATRENR